MDEDRTGSFPVTVDGWFRSGWYTFRNNGAALLRGVALMMAFSILVAMASYLPGGDLLGIGLQLTVGLVLTAGWLNFCLKLVREEQASPMDILAPFRDFKRVWTVAVSLALIVFAGSLAFIIPGFYLTMRLGMGMFTVIDLGTDVSGSIRTSWRMTAGHEGKLIVYYLIMLGLIGISVFPTFAGRVMLGAVTSVLFNFLAAPLLGATYASAYDSLLFLGGHATNEDDSGEGPGAQS